VERDLTIALQSEILHGPCNSFNYLGHSKMDDDDDGEVS